MANKDKRKETKKTPKLTKAEKKKRKREKKGKKAKVPAKGRVVHRKMVVWMGMIGMGIRTCPKKSRSSYVRILMRLSVKVKLQQERREVAGCQDE